jgi:hypothetical protein
MDAQKLKEAAEKFCRRVEAGEIRSKVTYSEFKEALAAQPTPTSAAEGVQSMPEGVLLAVVSERDGAVVYQPAGVVLYTAETMSAAIARTEAAEARVRELEAAVSHAESAAAHEARNADEWRNRALASRSLPTEAEGDSILLCASDLLNSAAHDDSELRPCICAIAERLKVLAALPAEAAGSDIHTLASDLLQYLDAHDWGGIPEGETANKLRDLLAAQPVPSKEAGSDGEAELHALLEKEFACYKTSAGLLHWAVNALLDNSPHNRPEAPSAEPVGDGSLLNGIVKIYGSTVGNSPPAGGGLSKLPPHPTAGFWTDLEEYVIKEYAAAACVQANSAALPTDLKKIAHLVGSIYFAGGFHAETANERELEALLVKTGYRYKSWSEVEAGSDAANGSKAD